MRGLLSLMPLLILLLLRLMRRLLSLGPGPLLLLLRLMLRLPLLLIQRAASIDALAASAAIAASTPPAPPTLATASGVETSGQSVAAFGSVQAGVKLFYTDEAILQVT